MVPFLKILPISFDFGGVYMGTTLVWGFFALLVFPVPAQRLETAFLKKKEKIRGSFVIEKEGDQTFLIISDDFKTKKGPDLQLVLSPLAFNEVSGKSAMNSGAVSIGPLKSHIGGGRYLIPKSLDLSKMKCVLIHCVKHQNFGVAVLLRRLACWGTK